MKQRKGLGRGLGALLPDKEAEENEKIVTDELRTELPIDKIRTNPYQPRTNFDAEALQELADSIRQQGIIQPITVRATDTGEFQLISGERRLQASKLVGLKTIPAYIRTADKQQMLEMALIENIQRENLNAIEVALSYRRLMQECDLKQEALGDRVGKKRSTVNNYLRLLKLPQQVQEGIRKDEISMGHARALLGIEDESVLLKVYKRIVEEDLSVRKVEDLVRAVNAVAPTGRKPKKTSVVRFEMLELQERLARWFEKKVLIKADERNKGEIKISFQSREELEVLLSKLKKK